MKLEIIGDVSGGLVPENCPSFSALHDYVDANYYGGFCDGEVMQVLIDHFGGIDEEKGMPDALITFLNNAHDSIDCWIKAGGILNSINNKSLINPPPNLPYVTRSLA
jgi:hypothetical protein